MAGRDVIIDIWSDYVCPFCYLEESTLQRIQEKEGEHVQIQWHAFELRPDPVPTLEPNGEYLRHTWARAVYPLAEQRGISLRLPPVQPRSRKALEAAEYARDRSCYEAMHHALFRAFFEQGRDIGSLEVLMEIGTEAGLDADGLRQALQGDEYTERVLQEEQRAQELGISAVPTMLIRRSDQPMEAAVSISGAQPYEWVQRAIAQVR